MPVEVWEMINLVRCALCWRQGLPEQGWQQRPVCLPGGTEGRCWFCPDHAAMVDREYASRDGLIGGAGS